MAFRTITGDPGTVWTNDSTKVWWQLQVQFRNSCGLCIQYANAIAPYFPLPFHPGCNCVQRPVRPGQSAKPFVDFQEIVRNLPPSQQTAAVGKSNWRLIEQGVIAWEDVVTPGRIRTFREVVARERLSANDLKNAGIRPGIINAALAVNQSPANVAAAARRQQLTASLRGLGVSDDRIRRELAGDLAARLGITPIGGQPPRPPGGPPVPPVAPAPAPIRPTPLAPAVRPQPQPQRRPTVPLPNPVPVPVAAEKPRLPAANVPPRSPSPGWIKRTFEAIDRFIAAVKARARRKAKDQEKV